MIIGQSRVIRPDWYDRNAESFGEAYASSESPHALVTRLTYTVPTGKIAHIDVLQTFMERTGKATVDSRVRVIITSTPFGGANFYIGEIFSLLPTVGDQENRLFLGFGFLFAGDQINFRTVDVSTGGLVRFKLGYKVTIFDA